MVFNGDGILIFEKISQAKPNQNNNQELRSEKYIWMFSNQQVELKKVNVPLVLQKIFF